MEPISKKDFLTTKMYDSFRKRSDDIGVKVSLNEPKFYITQNVAEVMAEEEKQKHLSLHDGHRNSFAEKMAQAECLSSENLARQCDHHDDIESDYEDNKHSGIPQVYCKTILSCYNDYRKTKKGVRHVRI